MRKILNKNLIFNLTSLTILVFALLVFIPIKADAQLSPLGGGVNYDFYGGIGTPQTPPTNPITPTTPPTTPTACTNSNWTSSLSPSTCPSSQQQTRTWTLTGTCSGGVTHSSQETVSCTYTAPPSTPPPTNPNPTINPAPSSNPAPLISSLSPSSATTCSGSAPITINGQNFLSSSTATWDGLARVTTYVSSTRLTIQPTDSDMCGLGNYIIAVSNPSPGGGTSNAVAFTLNPQTITGPTTPTTPTTHTTAKKTTKKTTATNTCSDENSLLAGGIFGSDGFMPQSLGQWLLLLILILLAIILWRKAYLTDKRKEKPLKHA